MIYAIATLHPRPAQHDALVAAFRDELPRVRAKHGSIEYSLAVHKQSGFPGQPPLDPDALIIVEKWSDLDSLKAHITDPHYQGWFSMIWQRLVASASMQVYESID